MHLGTQNKVPTLSHGPAYAKNKVFYQGNELVIFDGPGVKSKRDTYNHSYVMRHGLTHGPLNGIFIFVEYNPRIGSIMAEDFWEGD